MPTVSLSELLRFGPGASDLTGFPIATGTGFTPNNTVSVVSRWHDFQGLPDLVVTETFPVDEEGTFQNWLARTHSEGEERGAFTVVVTDLATGETATASVGDPSEWPRGCDYAQIAKVPVTDPGWLAVSPDGARIYTSLGYGTAQSQVNGVSVIEAATYAITEISIPNVRYGGSPLTLSADGSRLYVSTQFSLTVVDTATHGQIVLTMENDPTCSTLSTDGTRLYVLTNDKSLYRVEVLDVDPGSATFHTLVGSNDIGGYDTPRGIAATDRFVYLANNDLSFVRIGQLGSSGWGGPNGENTGIVVAPVPDAPGKHLVYLGISNGNQVAIFDEVADAGGELEPVLQQKIDLSAKNSAEPTTLVAGNSKVYAIGDRRVAVIDTTTTYVTYERNPLTGELIEVVHAKPIAVFNSFPTLDVTVAGALSPDGYTLYVTGLGPSHEQGYLQEINLIVH